MARTQTRRNAVRAGTSRNAVRARTSRNAARGATARGTVPRAGSNAAHGANPYSPPRSGGREHSTLRRQRRKGTPGTAWASVICAGLFLMMFLGMMAMLLTQVRHMQAGDSLTGSAVAVAGVGVMAILLWLSLITGVVTGIIALCQKDRPRGLAITGLVCNGVPLLWLCVNVFRGISALNGA